MPDETKFREARKKVPHVSHLQPLKAKRQVGYGHMEMSTYPVLSIAHTDSFLKFKNFPTVKS